MLEHPAVTHIASKVRLRKFNCLAENWAHSVVKLKVLKCIGLNPYNAVEMWKNYCPVVPPEFHNNWFYAEPTVEQWSKVKVEKLDRSEFWAALKAKKYVAKEAVERHSFDMDVGV